MLCRRGDAQTALAGKRRISSILLGCFGSWRSHGSLGAGLGETGSAKRPAVKGSHQDKRTRPRPSPALELELAEAARARAKGWCEEPSFGAALSTEPQSELGQQPRRCSTKPERTVPPSLFQITKSQNPQSYTITKSQQRVSNFAEFRIVCLTALTFLNFHPRASTSWSPTRLPLLRPFFVPDILPGSLRNARHTQPWTTATGTLTTFSPTRRSFHARSTSTCPTWARSSPTANATSRRSHASNSPSGSPSSWL